MDKETCEVRKYTEFEKLRGKEVVADMRIEFPEEVANVPQS